MATGHMTSCGIFGLDGTPWAASTGMPLTTEQVKTVIASVADVGKMTNGVTVNGERFILVRNDPGVNLVLKKGPAGLVAYKSAQAIIIALHDGNVKTEITLNAVAKVIEYLTKHGY